MKKLLTMIAVFALTAPVFADVGDPNVEITCEKQVGGQYDGLLRVDYEVLVEDVDPGLMRGIALDITTSNTATIEDIVGYDAEDDTVPADSTQIGSGYVVYMGSIEFNPNDPNYVTSFGDPVAPGTYPDTAGQLGSTGITVEMGSLYPEGGTAPPASGTLFYLEIDCQEEDPPETVITIAANTTRGGCVMESGSPANVVSAGCTFQCIPPCWSFPCFPYGDYDGDGNITYNEDVLPLINAWGNYYDPCCDKNMDGNITYNEDALPIINNWPTGCP
jgi:hypothetical protein